MDQITVLQYTQMFNFTGNLLSNMFWWNITAAPLPAGSYVLQSSASFFSCSGTSDQGIVSGTHGLMTVRTDVFWTNKFSVGQGGTIPANSTGNSMNSGNFSAVTAGQYDCTALRLAKQHVSIGLTSVYGAGFLFAGIVMFIVRGKNPVE
jgi:hypothetical protein